MMNRLKTLFSSKTAVVIIAAVLFVIAQTVLPEFAPLPYKIGIAMLTVIVLNKIDEWLWKDIVFIEELKNGNIAVGIVVGGFLFGLFYLLATA